MTTGGRGAGRTAGREQAVGSNPFGVTINPRTSAVYVTNLFQPGPCPSSKPPGIDRQAGRARASSAAAARGAGLP